MFINEYTAGRRIQTMPAWAGPIDLRGLPPHWRNARVIHLGPIAQEIDPKQTGSLTPYFLGLTPQGWMRDWPRETGGRVKLNHLRLPGELVGRRRYRVHARSPAQSFVSLNRAPRYESTAPVVVICSTTGPSCSASPSRYLRELTKMKRCCGVLA